MGRPDGTLTGADDDGPPRLIEVRPAVVRFLDERTRLSPSTLNGVGVEALAWMLANVNDGEDDRAASLADDLAEAYDALEDRHVDGETATLLRDLAADVAED